MGVAYVASHIVFGPLHWQFPSNRNPSLCLRRQSARVRVNCASVGASLPSGRAVIAADRPQQQSVRIGAASGSNAGAGVSDARSSNGVVVSATVATSLPSTQNVTNVISPQPPTQPAGKGNTAQPTFTPVPEDVIADFEHKLEADLQTVGVTLTAILGVIIFWRGVWALLDHFVGDSVVGDICCIIVGLTIVLYIRLSGMKIASFWPPS
ncbi:hypothetical protein Vretimale_16078 [Volvox reticuliferus]|uniref:Uncharacterized protein n=1 Tax=Volvox reticuliferus TaxID=1737510 RepID=A0A8J4GS43_9CHLO|nr:hypothetical protein Vretifemale_9687 [Volvox reticuliferus]GIM12840.1 hypothetical protein Vretimale_16078 [Volvox reticuliferus]